MSALFWENCQKLFEGASWLAFFKIDGEFIASKKIASKRSVVVRVVPRPGNTAIVIIREDPLESFNVCLLNGSTKFFHFFFGLNTKLFGVIPFFPAFFS
jgi:hypothetical protein